MGVAMEAARVVGPLERARAEMGRFAVAADTVSEDEFLALFADLSGSPWPDGFSCTAVDAESGELVVWWAEAGVEVHRAVASSCAVPGVYPPVTIGGRRHIDGGMRTALNADVAVGHQVVVVVVSVMPLAAPSEARDPLTDWLSRQQEAELEALRSAGAEVRIIGPDDGLLELSGMGLHLMDWTWAPAAFEIGLDVGQAQADQLRSVWST